MAKKQKFKLVPTKDGVKTMNIPEIIQVTKVRDIKQIDIVVDADNNHFSITHLYIEDDKLTGVQLTNGKLNKDVGKFELNSILRRRGNAVRPEIRDLIVAYE